MNQLPSTLNAYSLQKDFVLRLSSLFEGDFSIDWLVEITGLKASTIISILEEHAVHGPIRNVKPAVYAFELDSRQEWIDQLGAVEKERFHRNIAAILIREMPDDDNKPLLVSKHLIGLKNDWQDDQWIIRAGEIYAKRLCNDQSTICFRHVINTLADQQGENEDRLYIQAALGYSNSYLGKSDPQHFILILEEAKIRAKRIFTSAILPLLEMHIAKHERLASEDALSFHRFKKAFAKVALSNDPELVAESTVFRIYFTFWQGLFRNVIEIYETSVPDVHRTPIGSFPTLAAMMVGHCYTMVGQMTQGVGMLDTLHNYCIDHGDRYLAAYASSTIAMAMLSINRVEDALCYLKVSLKEADESNNIRIKALVILLLSLVFALKKNTKEFLKFFNRYADIGYDVHSNLHLNTYLLDILWYAQTIQVPLERGWDLEKEIDRVYALNNTFLKGVACRYQGLYECAHGYSHQSVIRSFHNSLKLLDLCGHKTEWVKTHMELARYYLSMGKGKKAKTILEHAGRMVPSAYHDLVPDDLRPLLGKEENENSILNELFELAGKLTAKTDKHKVLQHIIATANRMTGAERGALLLIENDASRRRLKLRASKNISMEQIDSPTFGASLQMIEQTVETRSGSIYETATAENGVFFPQDTIRSAICVPIIQADQVTGVLYHDNRLLGNIFKPSDLKLLSFLSALASLDLDRERAWMRIEQAKQQQNQAALYHLEEVEPSCGHPEGLLGKSPAFLETLSKITRVAKSDTAVLITGETGVGKNMVARVIHNQSDRCDKPFIIVQCSSLAESLITSELFGHEKGAFTGAVARSIGRFELAHGGTIFLDEIGDLSLDIQARLLRVLQSKEFERVGGGKQIVTSDFRLIAATNKNLEQYVKAGKFREDLYYRINVYPIEVPPLRERKEDIPLLVHHFLQIFNTKEKKCCTNITEQVMAILIHHPWPGNIRELENVVQRGVLSSGGAVFQLPAFEAGANGAVHNHNGGTFEDNIRQHILGALRTSRGKLYGPGGAADILQVNPSTLASRIKKLGIKKNQWTGIDLKH